MYTPPLAPNSPLHDDPPNNSYVVLRAERICQQIPTSRAIAACDDSGRLNESCLADIPYKNRSSAIYTKCFNLQPWNVHARHFIQRVTWAGNQNLYTLSECINCINTYPAVQHCINLPRIPKRQIQIDTYLVGTERL